MNIRHSSTALVLRFTLVGLLAVTASSCTSSREVDYKSYVKMPSKPSSAAMRTVLKSVPYTKKRAFYGNYGGSGCMGGLPADEMDEYFRRHDVVYGVAKSRRTMRLADEELVQALKRIDDESLSEEGRAFRDRAIRFMASPAANVVGKPVSSVLRTKEPLGGYFSEPESVHKFFQPTHPGVPDPAAGSMPRLRMKGGTGIGVSRQFRALEM